MKKAFYLVSCLLCVCLTGCHHAEPAVQPTDDGFTYLSATDPRMVIGGITHPSQNNGEYYRLDALDQQAYSEAVAYYAKHTSGATVRFRTDADQLALRVSMRSPQTAMCHMADRGAYGFDVYVGEGGQRIYCGQPLQLFTHEEGFTEYVALPQGDKEVLINLPLYGGVVSVEVGLPDGASLTAPAARARGTIGFYGSSITQGACVSRPGSAYPNIICRTLDADCMNLGFSGVALGEQAIAEYIASRELAAFVLDYDHNNTVEGLRDTHYAFYETVRKAHPDLPIVMVTQPVFTIPASEEQLQRQSIIEASYRRARENGDENVYYVCGGDFFPDERIDLYTVDMLHPNDLGHYHMAQAIGAVLEEVLKR